jgi:hypothetical protein
MTQPAVLIPTGPRGPTGATGATGPAGPQGPPLAGYIVPARDSTDNASLLNDAMAAGPAIIWIKPGNWPIKSSIILRSNCRLQLAPGAILRWAGTDGGPMIESPSDEVLVHAGIECGSGYIDMGTGALAGVKLHSTQFSELDLVFRGDRADSIALEILGDSSASTGSATGSRNTVSNRVKRLLHEGDGSGAGSVGKLLRLQGGPTAGGAALGSYGAVTINQFGFLRANFCKQIGIDFDQWCDSNTFSEQVLIRLSANDAIGVRHGDAGLAGTVYNEVFTHLIISPYGTFTGRIGVYYGNLTKDNAIERLYIDGGQLASEGGNVVAHSAAQSFDIGSLTFAGTDGSVMRNVNKARLYQGMSFESNVGAVTVPDDTAVSFKLGLNRTRAILAITGGIAGGSCLVYANPGGGAAPRHLTSTEQTLVSTFATALAGTTGTDGHLNIGVDNTMVYIENRLSADYKFNVAQLASI